jgi:hypothetical protein
MGDAASQADRELYQRKLPQRIRADTCPTAGAGKRME